MSHRLPVYIVLVFALFSLAACAALTGERRFPVVHPPEADLGQRPPICTECHAARSDKVVYERYNHTRFFAADHRQEGTQDEALCSMCHERSYCNDCHVTRVELKPSSKYPTDTWRVMPHRGDYLSRHQLDGRADPTSCFRCHGNPRTTKGCVSCHG